PSVLERRLFAPLRLVHVDAEGALEGVAAALGDRVDDTAGEPTVLGRDTGSENLGLLDRVFDEETVAATEDRVLSVDAVDHHGVVVRHRAVDRHLPGEWTVVGQAWGEVGDQAGDAADRKLVDDLFVQFGAQ